MKLRFLKKRFHSKGAVIVILGLCCSAAISLSSCSKGSVTDVPSTPKPVVEAVLPGQVGYCNENGTTTGGAAGPTVTVNNATDLNTYATASQPYVIRVSGTITLSSRVEVASNKTIQGVNASAKIVGNIYIANGANNVIVSNLNITNPAGDGITIRGAHHVWVNHCAIFDCSDGLCDINYGADYVTVSWTKFYYVNQVDHRYTMILGSAGAEVEGKLHVTLHHNWWGPKCDQRMPSGTLGNAHIFNNYFTSEGNFYCSNARAGSKWWCENNYYYKVKNPCYEQDGGKIRTIGNIYDQCTGSITVGGTSVVSQPTYSYTLTAAASVPSVVSGGAGPQATPAF